MKHLVLNLLWRLTNVVERNNQKQNLVRKWKGQLPKRRMSQKQIDLERKGKRSPTLPSHLLHKVSTRVVTWTDLQDLKEYYY